MVVKVDVAVVCQHASSPGDGSLSVNGIFTAVTFPSLPGQIPVVFLVFRLRAPAVETKGGKTFQIILTFPSGKTHILDSLNEPSPAGNSDAHYAVFNIVLQVINFVAEEVGIYTYSLKDGENELATAEFMVSVGAEM